jgi:hypothetical protein
MIMYRTHIIFRNMHIAKDQLAILKSTVTVNKTRLAFPQGFDLGTG